MQEIDDELVARTARWCADAGRPTADAEVRAALAPLSWDELLAARAMLADPPPARPLGPRALADIARGASPVVAAERERGGLYGVAGEPAAPGAAPAPPRERRRPPGERGKRPRPAAGPVIRRARDRAEPLPPVPRRLAALDELFASEGRAVLERLVREHGARRGTLCTALSAGWQRADGGAVREEDLEALLDAHGLARSFERRERDELLHALRAAAGLKARAAALVGLAQPAFDAALERLGAGDRAEAIRAAHRDELRRRGTLSERVRLLMGEAERLADLGLLEEFQADLRQRLPEHLRALRASGAAPLDAALGRSLSIGPREVDALTAQLGLLLGEPMGSPSPPARDAPRPGRGTPPRGGGPRRDRVDRGAPARGRVERGAPARDRAGRGGAPGRDRDRLEGARPRPQRPQQPKGGEPSSGRPDRSSQRRSGPRPPGRGGPKRR